MATYDGSMRIRTAIDNSGIKKGLKSTEQLMESSVNHISGSLKKLASLIATTFSLTQLYSFSKECVNEASKMQSALVGLQSIVEGQGRSFEKAQAFIKAYTEDGLIPASNAITAYKNLAARGYDDNQIQQTLTALKDSAAFGRQSAYKYGEAIETATEGLKNENSILVDNAGVTKNVAKMWEDYAKSIGTTTNKLTTQQKIQAEVNGILEETRFQTGDAIKYAQTYEGQSAKLSASLLNLKQNIGALLQGAFGTVIQWAGKAIEYVNILVQAIGEVISMFTGKNPLNGFSNEIKDTSNAIKDTSSGISGIGSEADKTSKKVKNLDKQLTGFDKINKLSRNKDTSSASSSGGITSSKVNGGATINDLGFNSKLTDRATAKIKKLAKQIKSFLDTVLKTLKKFEPMLKGIGTAFLVAFGLKWITGAIKKFFGLSAMTGIITAIKTALIAMTTVMGLTGNPLKALVAGFEQLWKSLMNGLKNLSGMQKLQVSAVALTASFITTYNAVKDFASGTSDLGTMLLNIVPIATAAGVAMYGMYGPIGLIIEAVTLVVAAFTAFNQAQIEAREELSNSIMYADAGVKIDTLTEALVDSNKGFTDSIAKIKEYSETIEDNNQTIDENVKTIGYYTDKIKYGGGITKEEATKIKEAFTSIKDATKQNIELASKGILETFGTTLKDVAGQVGVNIGIISKHLFDFQKEFGTKTTELDKQIDSLSQKLMDGTATEAEINQLYKLGEEYAALNTKVSETTVKYNEQVEAFNSGKVNFENQEEAKQKLQEFGETFNQLLSETGNAKTQAIAEVETILKQIPLVVSDPKKQEELTTAFDSYKEKLKQGFELKEEDIKSNFFTQVQRIQISFDENLDKIGKETPNTFWENYLSCWIINQDEKEKFLKKSVAKSVQELNQPLKDEIDVLVKETKPKAVEAGENIPISIKDGVHDKASLPRDEVKRIIDDLDTTDHNKKLLLAYMGTGRTIDEGLGKGISEQMGVPKQEAENLANMVLDATKITLDSHSPSRKFIQIGNDVDEGLANGIRDRRNIVINEAQNMANDLMSIFRNMNLSFNINFPDITHSGNSLISRFQTMLNNITSGINSWLARTTSSLNGLYVSDGRVYYSGISRVRIPRLAKGGIAYRPTYAQIGEAGKEAILPLENNTDWMDTFAEKLSQKIGFKQNENGDIIIYVNLDGETIQKIIKKKQKKHEFATNGGI